MPDLVCKRPANMKRAMVQPVRCQNCTPCRVQEQCPKQAIFREVSTERPWIDFYRCSGCEQCVPVCPNHAIEVIMQPCNGQRKLGW